MKPFYLIPLLAVALLPFAFSSNHVNRVQEPHPIIIQDTTQNPTGEVKVQPAVPSDVPISIHAQPQAPDIPTANPPSPTPSVAPESTPLSPSPTPSCNATPEQTCNQANGVTAAPPVR